MLGDLWLRIVAKICSPKDQQPRLPLIQIGFFEMRRGRVGSSSLSLWPALSVARFLDKDVPADEITCKDQ